METDLISTVETFSIFKYLKYPSVTVNLIVCWVTFMAANFNYYMINFYMKYAGGNIFINVILLTVSENIAYNTGSFIQSKFGTRKTFFLSYLSAIVFWIPLIFWDDIEWVVMVSVFLSRFGVAASYTLIYYVNQEIHQQSILN